MYIHTRDPITYLPDRVEISCLPSGMTVITMQRRSALAVAGVAFDAGTLDDPEDCYGLAHLLEHVLFEGPSRDGVHPRFRSLIECGTDINAQTGCAYTDYNAIGFSRDIRAMVQSLMDMVFEPEFVPELIREEKQVQLAELGNAMGYEQQAWVERMLYPDEPMLQYPLGKAEHFERMTPDMVERFHASHYVAGRSAIIVVGDAHHEQVLDMVLDHPANALGRRSHAGRQPRQPCFQDAARSFAGMQPQMLIYFPRDLGEPGDTLGQTCMDMLCAFPLGLMVQQLRMQDRIIHSLGYSQRPWPHPRIDLDVFAAEEHFGYVRDVCRRSLERMAAGDIPADLLASAYAQAELRFAGWDEMHGWDFYKYLRQRWVSSSLDDIDPRAQRRAVTPEALAGMAARLLAGECGILRACSA